MMFKKTLRLLLAAALVMALTAAPALAKVVNPGEDFYYLDKANVLSEELEGEIYFCNQLLEEACGAQIVVVALDTTGTEAIDDYSYDLMNKWGIGDADKQNGLLILLAIGDDNYYIVPGPGLQSKLSAGSIGDLKDKYLEPNFAAGDYEAGVRQLFEALYGRIAGIYDANVTVQQGVAAYKEYVAANAEAEGYGGYEWTGGEGRGSGEDESEGSAMLGLVVVLIIILVVVLAKRSSRRRAVRRPVVSDEVATMIAADRMLRNARSVMRAPHIIPTRTSPGYRPFSFGGSSSYSSRPSSSSRSSGSLFGGSSSSSRSSGSSFRSSSSSRSSGFGGGHGGGGGTRGGGVGRGRH